MLDKFSLFFKYKNCTQINLCVKSSYLKNSPKSCGSAWTAKEKRNKTNEIHTTQKYIQNSVKETWTSVNPSSTRSPRPQPRPLDLCYREQRSIPLRRRQRLRKQLILIRVYSSIKSRRGSRESGRVSFGAHDYPAALVTPRWSPFPQTNCRLNGGEIPRRRDPLAVFDLACYVPLHTNRVLFSRTLFFSLSLSFSLFSLFCLGYASVQGGGSPPSRSRESRWGRDLLRFSRRSFSGKSSVTESFSV